MGARNMEQRDSRGELGLYGAFYTHTKPPARIGCWLAVSVSNALTCAGHDLAKYTILLRSTQIHTYMYANRGLAEYSVYTKIRKQVQQPRYRQANSLTICCSRSAAYPPATA
eukprot:COSAG01_NODE_249_length_20357_cov_3.458171_29_plen_112_part_00